VGRHERRCGAGGGEQRLANAVHTMNVAQR
jgi:hypothetical protein